MGPAVDSNKAGKDIGVGKSGLGPEGDSRNQKKMIGHVTSLGGGLERLQRGGIVMSGQLRTEYGLYCTRSQWNTRRERIMIVPL